jgi:hypothetical protein
MADESGRALDAGRSLNSGNDGSREYSTYYSEHYVYPPYDAYLGAWAVGRDVKYPQYENDHWARINSYDWRQQQLNGVGPHRSEIYAPLNENAQKSLTYRKYVPDSSGMPTYWYRHTIEPSYEWMFEQGS